MTLLNCLILAFLLFGIGVWGLMRRRHLVGMLISIELMLLYRTRLDCGCLVQYFRHCRDRLRNGDCASHHRHHVPPAQES